MEGSVNHEKCKTGSAYAVSSSHSRKPGIWPQSGYPLAPNSSQELPGPPRGALLLVGLSINIIIIIIIRQAFGDIFLGTESPEYSRCALECTHCYRSDKPPRGQGTAKLGEG